jgi:hypothetical protein
MSGGIELLCTGLDDIACSPLSIGQNVNPLFWV